jgi:hypothetical protein
MSWWTPAWLVGWGLFVVLPYAVFALVNFVLYARFSWRVRGWRRVMWGSSLRAGRAMIHGRVDGEGDKVVLVIEEVMRSDLLHQPSTVYWEEVSREIRVEQFELIVGKNEKVLIDPDERTFLAAQLDALGEPTGDRRKRRAVLRGGDDVHIIGVLARGGEARFRGYREPSPPVAPLTMRRPSRGDLLCAKESLEKEDQKLASGYFGAGWGWGFGALFLIMFGLMLPRVPAVIVGVLAWAILFRGMTTFARAPQAGHSLRHRIEPDDSEPNSEAR